MFPTIVTAAITATVINLATPPAQEKQPEVVLSSQTYSLEHRQEDRTVNEVFSDNILLSLAYMRGFVNKDASFTWEEIRKPLEYEFTLEKGQTFAFHNIVLPEYEGKVTKSTNSNFGVGEKYKTFNGLPGNGVCHLASFMNKVGKDAELLMNAPTNHDFAAINQIDKKDGVAIYSESGSQNLYITNNKDAAIKYKFNFDGKDLKISVVKVEKDK